LNGKACSTWERKSFSKVEEKESHKERHRTTRLEPFKDYLKDYITCLKKDVYCRGCEYEEYCKTIAIRKEMGMPNPWERAWLDRKVRG